MYRPTRREIHPAEETLVDLAGEPKGGPYQKWFGGILLPVAFVGYGLWCLVTGEAKFPAGKQQPAHQLTDEAAIAMGVAYIAIGLFFHFHYLWGQYDRLHRYSQPLKVVSLIVFLPCFLYGIAFALNLSSWLQF